MTNKEYLDNMSEEEYISFMDSYKNCVAKPYVDFERFLKSEYKGQINLPVQGYRCRVRDETGKKSAKNGILVGTFHNRDSVFGKVLVPMSGMDYQLISVPMEHISMASNSFMGHKFAVYEQYQLLQGDTVVITDLMSKGKVFTGCVALSKATGRPVLKKGVN